MRSTVEVRWFEKGSIPGSVASWFERLAGEVAVQSPRTDRYLLPTHAGTNVKLREGRVEIKRRDGDPDVVTFASGLTGQLGHWRKWAFPTETSATQYAGETSWWIDVTKARRMRAYHVDEEGAVQPGTWGAPSARGCGVELAHVSVHGETWWSLCLEAFGEAGRRVDVLRCAAAHVTATGTPPELGTEQSFGYPEWLLRTR